MSINNLEFSSAQQPLSTPPVGAKREREGSLQSNESKRRCVVDLTRAELLDSKSLIEAFQNLFRRLPTEQESISLIRQCSKYHDFISSEINLIATLTNHFPTIHPTIREILPKIPRAAHHLKKMFLAQEGMVKDEIFLLRVYAKQSEILKKLSNVISEQSLAQISFGIQPVLLLSQLQEVNIMRTAIKQEYHFLIQHMVQRMLRATQGLVVDENDLTSALLKSSGVMLVLNWYFYAEGHLEAKRYCKECHVLDTQEEPQLNPSSLRSCRQVEEVYAINASRALKLVELLQVSPQHLNLLRFFCQNSLLPRGFEF